MRFSLRTLLIVLVIAPPLLAALSITIDNIITALHTPPKAYCCPDVAPRTRGRYVSAKQCLKGAKCGPVGDCPVVLSEQDN